MTIQTTPLTATDAQPQQIAIHRFGAASSKTLTLEAMTPEVSQDLAADEVLVVVHYSGINFADIMMRLGFYPDAPAKPFVPGYEVSGIVKAIGAQVTHVAVGDEVMCGTYFGGYASEVKVAAWQVIPKPRHLTLAESAAIPVAFLTLYTALFAMARLRQGDRILIDCATGGLGIMAMQLAKHTGASGVGLTSSPAKKSLIASYGFVAMTHDEWQGTKDCYDIILNSQGGSSLRQHYQRLAPSGRVVGLGLSSGVADGKRRFLPLIKSLLATPRFSMVNLMNDNRGVFGINALRVMQDQDLAKRCTEHFGLIEQLGIKPHVGATFPAQDAHLAHRQLETRAARGKLLLAWH